MGLGRRTFAPGEVLTASNVMNYLQDQAVMSFAGTAARGSAIGTAVAEGMVSYLQDTNFLQVRDDNAWHSLAGVQTVANATVRDSLIPSPNQGDKVFRSDLGYEQTYYALYNASTNPGGRASAGWYNDQRNMGLTPIVAPTISISGGTATVNTLGTITVSSVTSVALNNVFTSAYEYYRVDITRITNNATAAIDFRLRASGSDSTAAIYDWAHWILRTNSTTQVYASTATTSGRLAFGINATAEYSSAILEIRSPQIATQTNWVTQSSSRDSGGQFTFNGAGWHNATTQYDGITIFPTAGSFSGKITVTGFNS